MSHPYAAAHRTPRSRPGLLPCALALLAACSIPVSAGAQGWNETVDAGDLPATAQTTVGKDPLLTIDGNLDSENDVDMYCFKVTEPTSFIARLGCVVIQGPDIWLFDSAGLGVSANFLCQSGDKRVSGAFATTAGTYYLAVSYRGRSPLSGADAIWLANNNPEHAPDGPGAGGAVTSWTGTGNVQPINPYRITLTGAGFCDAPTATEAGSWGRLKSIYR